MPVPARVRGVGLTKHVIEHDLQAEQSRQSKSTEHQLPTAAGGNARELTRRKPADDVQGKVTRLRPAEDPQGRPDADVDDRND